MVTMLLLPLKEIADPKRPPVLQAAEEMVPLLLLPEAS
jgi:hypothetical protein